MAAFTMTTVLLLGLLSAAAIGATRAVTGAPADDTVVSDPTVDVGDDAAEDGDAEPARGAKSAARTKKGAKPAKGDTTGTKAEPRRAGGAMSPGDALKRSTSKPAAGDAEEP